MPCRQHFRLALLAALGLCALLLYSWSPFAPLTPRVQAHAFVIGSDPIDGSTVTTAPRVMRIYFNGTISPASRAQVIDASGRVVNAGPSVIPAGNPRELDTPLLPPSQLAQGSYLVRWTALSSDDGHTTQGAIGFNIGHSSTGLPGQVILGPSTSNYLPTFSLLGGLSIAWNWLVLLALTFWVGSIALEYFVLEPGGYRPELRMQARKHGRPLLWLSLAALLVGEVISLILRTSLFNQGLGGAGINFTALSQVLFSTGYGYLWLARAALLLLALAFLWWTTRAPSGDASASSTTRARPRPRSNFARMRQQVTQEQRITKERITTEEEPVEAPALPPRWHAFAWSLLAALVLLSYALTSHPAQRSPLPVSAVAFDWLYLAAQATWFGGLAYLNFVLLPILPVVEPDRHAETLVSLTRRLAPMLVIALCTLAVSLLFVSESTLENALQFFSEPYGRSLLVMLALLFVMLLLTGYILLTLSPRLSRQALLLPVVNADLPARRTRRSALEQTLRGLKKMLNILAGAAAAVLLCAALMNFFAPPIVFPNINYAQAVQNQTPATPAPSQPQTQHVGDLNVSLLVEPARVGGSNTVSVRLSDSRGNAVTNAQVQLAINMTLMDMGTARQTINGGHPDYIATFTPTTTFDMPGPWKIIVTIQRPGQAPLQTSFTVIVS